MLSIIIVTYNGMPWLQKCLDSCKNYSVIVVDNASEDGTVAFIKEHYPEVTLLPQNKNLGFGQANNLGISLALKNGAEHVFLLNQDAYLIDNCIEQLVAAQKNNPAYGVLSPIHLNGKGNSLDEKFVLYLNRYKVMNKLLYDTLMNNIKIVYPINFVNAAGWLLSKKCLETIGGFDPLFFHYGEDRNYCQRVIFHNFQIGVVPFVYMQHDRENRIENKIEPFSKKYYDEFVRYTKVDWGDINLEDFLNKYDLWCKMLLRKTIKQLLYFNFKEGNNCLKKRRLLIKLKPEILKSRSENVKLKANYL